MSFIKETLPTDLIEAVKAEKVILFLGAGCSINAGMPSWKSLVVSLLNKLEKYDRNLTTLIPPLENDLISPLDILDKLAADHKEKIYNHLYETLKRKDQENFYLQKKLANLSSKIITTNFDKTLEESTNNEIRVISSISNYSMAQLRDIDSYIFKAHGDIEAPDKCAIFSSDYDQLYRSDGMFHEIMRNLIATHTFLFVGFSLTDPYFNRLFDMISNIYGDYARKSFSITKERTNRSNIEDILIENHDEIPKIIDFLEKETAKKNDTPKQETSKKTDDIELHREGIDIPPDVGIFVGRDEELRLLRQRSSKVYCVSGIGGQGKSALASQFMKEHKTSYRDSFWRDFKEEGHIFVAKILSIIKFISGKKHSDSLFGSSEEAIIESLFDAIGNGEYLIVLDNVDSYISAQNPDFIGPLGKLITEAEKRPHRSTFIVTCRPFIFHASANFHQIKLKDLQEEEVDKLFEESDINIANKDLKEAAKKTFQITNGHPLWTTLVLRQAARGKKEFESFLSDIEKRKTYAEDDFSVMAEECLSSIWESLNRNQKELLRILSESPGSDSVEELQNIVSKEMNFQRFSKSLKVLRSFGLVIEKSEGHFFELHPLVKQFIRDKYPGAEQRSKYIALFVDYLGRAILILRPKLKTGLSYDDCEKWTNKVKLNLQRKRVNEAFNDLSEIFLVMQSSGYTEELTKTILDFLSSVSWEPGFERKMKDFDSRFNDFLGTLSEYGETESAKRYLEKFKSYIDSNGERFLRALGIETYINWISGDLPSALESGEHGEYLLAARSAEDNYNIGHNLALTRRDIGGKSNIEQALKHFLKGEAPEEAIETGTLKSDYGAQYYGNIGRCFQLLNMAHKAEICFAKSYKILDNSWSHNKMFNTGYACLWIFELLPLNHEKSLFFLNKSARCWKDTSPPKFNELREKYSPQLKSEKYISISGIEDWRINKECSDWVSSILKNTQQRHQLSERGYTQSTEGK
ncbi:MAG: SIR2 family protein [Alcanivorax sp.]|uniref:SIR2 family protein n=1 Tax=Alcanivorax sp. TaxID=1872427 RepID=UPI0026241979|nr:SIR2 family protein [Alcanivorax sp.]MDF1723278.1 SIR2 family protein [Alcanivorax sp.]